MATANQILTRLDALLQLHFPDKDGAPRSSIWQPEYFKDFCELAFSAVNVVNEDKLRQYLREDWLQCDSRRLSEQDHGEIEELMVCWRAWQFGRRVDSGYYEA